MVGLEVVDFWTSARLFLEIVVVFLGNLLVFGLGWWRIMVLVEPIITIFRLEIFFEGFFESLELIPILFELFLVSELLLVLVGILLVQSFIEII